MAIFVLADCFPIAYKWYMAKNRPGPPGSFSKLAAQLRLAVGERERHGGIMRIGKALTIPALITLGMAGPVLASTVTTMAAGQTAGVQVQALGAHAGPFVYYNA
jgi:hypothetical protein